ncbi:ATP-binding cassette domain-containing protein [Thermofilum sp.]|jgi:energy-coupling factor transport system ATP-binding protein|uniref:energy-coupling factor ABC transporter ATP-binding protein n=1 Tax=Thermofilum sp. TaxID=1961369 RepID=UPI0025852388|nr:ATP-binding cassette domain-containing protein [Thermofilum sp.]
MGPSVVVRNLSAKYIGSDTWTVRAVDLQVNKGEMVVIMGPSGCGKTTLFRILAGLVPSLIPGTVEGEVTVEGVDVVRAGYKQLVGVVGLVYQNPEMQVITRSVLEELAMGPENLGLSREEIQKRIDWVTHVLNLYDLLDKDPQSLSGGEKQLIAIASVLTIKPKVLLLDEPTSMLDHRGTRLVLEAINQLKKEGLTILVAEHRVEWAVEAADRVAVMGRGTILLEGKPEEVFSRVEDIQRYGVRPPGIAEVAYELRKKGIDVPIPVKLEDGWKLWVGSK